jgi:hypothetical protein
MQEEALIENIRGGTCKKKNARGGKSTYKKYKRRHPQKMRMQKEAFIKSIRGNTYKKYKRRHPQKMRGGENEEEALIENIRGGAYKKC